MFITKCPFCGADIRLDEEREFCFCSSCGSRVDVAPGQWVYEEQVQVVQMPPVQQVAPTYMQNPYMMQPQTMGPQPNLIIEYSSSHPGVAMVVRIVSTGQKSVYHNGQNMSYNLPSGSQTIVLKIGKINYNRNVFINPAQGPVIIRAGWMGRAYINIEQPPVTQADINMYR